MLSLQTLGRVRVVPARSPASHPGAAEEGERAGRGPGGAPGGAAIRRRQISGTGIWRAGRCLGDRESSVPSTACPAADRKEEFVLLASEELHRSKISINGGRERSRRMYGRRDCITRAVSHVCRPLVWLWQLTALRSLFLHLQACSLKKT